MNARAIVFRPPGRVSVEAVEVPPPGPGEILIQTAFSGISPGTELRCLAGQQVGAPSDHFIPGYSLTGVVVETGPQTTIACGTQVYATGTKRANRPLLWGGHCSLAVCPESAVVRLPSGVSMRDAAVLKIAAISAHGVALAPAKASDRVVVVGLGPIGLAAALMQSSRGANVVGVDLNAARIAHARSCGLRAVSGHPSAKDAIAEVFPHGADLVIDSTGSAAVLPSALQCLAPLGWDDGPLPARRLVIQGSYAGSVTLPYDQAFLRQVQLYFPRDAQRVDLEYVLREAQESRFDLRALAPETPTPADRAAPMYSRFQDDPDAPPTAIIAW